MTSEAIPEDPAGGALQEGSAPPAGPSGADTGTAEPEAPSFMGAATRRERGARKKQRRMRAAYRISPPPDSGRSRGGSARHRT